MSTPLDIDNAIATAAVRSGLTNVTRREEIAIDASLLPAHLYRKVPDYREIRRLLNAGATVPGARMTGRVEYVLREQEEQAS